MKEKKIVLNPYRIYWATLIPCKNAVTKHDAILIDSLQRWYHVRGRKELSVHAPSKEKLIEKLTNLEGLDKSYTAYLYTDKQFGMRKIGQPLFEILTTKQKAEPIIIKGKIK